MYHNSVLLSDDGKHGCEVLSRSEFGCGVVVKDTVVDLTGVSSYWRSIFSDRRTSTASRTPPTAAAAAAAAPTAMDSMMMCGITDAQKLKPTMMPPCPQHTSCASHTPISSVLGNSICSNPRLNTVSTGFVDALLSCRRNMGYFARDFMAGTYNPRER